MVMLATSSASGQMSTTDRVMDELYAVHPHSSPGIMTATPSGSYCYIAGGRFGLWAMDAGASTGIAEHKAYRIDDSGNLNPATQGGRRWCNDVEVFTVSEGGVPVEYVAVLAARQDNSMLRIHKLSALRSHYVDHDGQGNEVHRYLLFVIDFGGRLYVYEITDLLTYTVYQPGEPHLGAVLPYTPILTYDTLRSRSDKLRNNIHGMALDVASWTEGGNTPVVREEHYVYLPVTRVGIEVLRFRMNQGVASLKRVRLIQTTGELGSVEIVDHPTAPGQKLLYVADYNGGLRIYQYSF